MNGIEIILWVYPFIWAIIFLIWLLSGGQIQCEWCGMYNSYSFIKPKKCGFCKRNIKKNED